MPSVVSIARSAHRIPDPARILGFAGLVPFWAAMVVAWGVPAWSGAALAAQLLYGALILSFLGGVHWGDALMAPDWPRLGWSVTPCLIGWASLAFDPGPGAATQTLAFVACLIMDLRRVTSGHLPPWYGKLRLWLTGGVLVAQGLAAARLWM